MGRQVGTSRGADAMMGWLSGSPLRLALVVLVALCSAFAGFHAIGALAEPTRQNARLDTVREALERVEQVGGGQISDAYPEHAVCTQALLSASSRLQRTLSQEATRAGLAVDLLTVAADGGSAASGLAPLRVQVQASGSLEGAVRLTAALDQSRPTVFVDRYELRHQRDGVSLKLTGRAFCWISAGK